MCTFFIAALTGGVLTAGAYAGELLFRDNFNHPDTNIFDNASLAGRLSGTLASNIVSRSSIAQQTIQGNQLRMISPAGIKTGRIAFNKQDLSARFDWAAGTTGTSILNAGRLRVEFDYTSPVLTSDWIAFCIGHDTSDPDRRIVDPETDYGILLRGNGGAQRFDNGSGVAVGSFTSPHNNKQHVMIDFDITSFADGASVDVVVTVSGIQIDSYTFTWDNNNGEIYMELGSYFTGALIDSYSVSTAKTVKSSLFKDNFDVADATSFDGASISGRLSGKLDTQIKLASAKAQQQISGNQLSMVKAAGSGRVRFQLQTGGWHNWATNETSALILDAGGLIVGFDWTTASITTGDWISFNVGFASGGAEPTTRVNNGGTDYGILFRGNGGTQRFDNGAGVAAGTFTPSTSPQHVELRFNITSFEDGESVDVVVTVGGTQVDSYTFDLAENNGEFYMELGTYLTGMLIDNYSVDLIPPPTGTIIIVQ